MNPTPTSRIRRARAWIEYTLVFVIVTAGAWITWVRVPPDHRRRPWAEDANLFLAEAIDHGPWDVLFRGYAGYQHLIPRMVIAVIYPYFDIVVFPMLIFAICAVLTGFIAAAVFWLSRDLVVWLPARLTLAAITLLLPLAAQESIGNLADLHSYAMWLIPWLLLYRPRRWPMSVAWAIVTFLTVMTEIQTVFFIWLVFFRFRRNNARAYPIFAAFAAGAVGQIATALLVKRGTGNGPLTMASTVMGWMVNTVIPLVQANPVAVRQLLVSSGLLLAYFVLIPIVAAAAYALWKGSGSQRLLTVALLLGSAATYTASAWANSGEFLQYAEVGFQHMDKLMVNSRYGVSSGMLLAAVVPLAASVWVSRHRVHTVAIGRSTRRTAAALTLPALFCVALVAVLWHASTDTFSLRNTVAEWPISVQTAIAGCRSGTVADPVTLPVAPWRSMDISCNDLLQLHR